tara:strand:- start:3023 stop:3652 length:630 start_codon:yes stop_codon:yes gene_type:complete
MAIPHSELQKLNPNSIIELFELELVEGLHYATGNPTSVTTVFRFHAGTNIDSYANIVWQSNTYQRFPVEAKGYEYAGEGKIPRPTLVLSNLGGITRVAGGSSSVIRVTDLLAAVNLVTAHNDLLDAKVTRRTLTADSLDASNFSGGSNPFGTPSTNEFPQEIYFIDRKIQESRDVVSFELVNRLDMENKTVPARQVTRKDFEGVGTFIN